MLCSGVVEILLYDRVGYYEPPRLKKTSLPGKKHSTWGRKKYTSLVATCGHRVESKIGKYLSQDVGCSARPHPLHGNDGWESPVSVHRSRPQPQRASCVPQRIPAFASGFCLCACRRNPPVDRRCKSAWALAAVLTVVVGVLVYLLLSGDRPRRRAPASPEKPAR